MEVDIRTLRTNDGSIPSRAMGLVMEWAAEHQGELAEDWHRASFGEPILRIPPLA
ncbi:MAG: DUF4160 domain-containing protein [Candidatus Limnocylindrales bacterium]